MSNPQNHQPGPSGAEPSVGTGWQVLRNVSTLLKRRFAKLPVKRDVVYAALAPIYGRKGVRLYYAGVRKGYADEGYWMSGKHPCYSMGLRDGSELKRDPSCWPRILQAHLDRTDGKTLPIFPCA